MDQLRFGGATGLIRMTPEEILRSIHDQAAAANESVVADEVTREKIQYVALCTVNRAGVRLLMACLLGKLHRPRVDPRNPWQASPLLAPEDPTGTQSPCSQSQSSMIRHCPASIGADRMR